MQLSNILGSLAILTFSAKLGLAAPFPGKKPWERHCLEWSRRTQYCYKYEDGWDINGKIEPGALTLFMIRFFLFIAFHAFLLGGSWLRN